VVIKRLIFFSKGAFAKKKWIYKFSTAINDFKSKLKHFRKIEDPRFRNSWRTVITIFGNLEPRLREKYDAKPVHTLQEITKLKSNFPDNIKFSVL
jgi:hypothetical protein